MTRVVERVLALMECFDEEKPSLPLHEIAARAGLPKATAFRLLSTLVETGYVLQLANQDYCLSHKLMRLAAIAQRTFSIRDIARAVMIEVVSATGETVDLSVLNGTNRVCVDVLESPHPLKSIIRPGETVALGRGASGKLLLAYNEDALLDRVIAESAGSLDKAALARNLRSIRKQGFAHSRGERVEGAEAISVPLRDHTGQVPSCLTLTGPSFRFSSKLQRFTEIMIDAGRRISLRLGAADPQANTHAA
ncbi:IclR family transcriptional regulator [Microvirga antarctica]|uniref:IclR family transcriptional regulator n=1 Tax=Microvirga antarctica TaxID=2819233 RepID=UPI001B30CCE3|nr:IclR family transcriptional regulator [Microvirga antarctica]